MNNLILFSQAFVASMVFYGLIGWFWFAPSLQEYDLKQKKKSRRPTKLFSPFLDNYNNQKNSDYFQEQEALELYTILRNRLKLSELPEMEVEMVPVSQKLPLSNLGLDSGQLRTEDVLELYKLSYFIKTFLLSQSTSVFEKGLNLLKTSLNSFTIEEIEHFLNLPLYELMYLSLGFVGRKVYQLTLFVYAMFIFSKWKELGINQSVKFDIFFNYAFHSETRYFVFQILKFVVGDNNHSNFFSFGKKDLKEQIERYLAKNKSLVELSLPLRETYAPSEKFLFDTSNIIALSNFLLQTFNYKVWNTLNSKEKLNFLKVTKFMTVELGSFRFIHSYLYKFKVTGVPDSLGPQLTAHTTNQISAQFTVNFSLFSNVSRASALQFNYYLHEIVFDRPLPSQLPERLNGDNQFFAFGATRLSAIKFNRIVGPENKLMVSALGNTNIANLDSSDDEPVETVFDVEKTINNTTILLTDVSKLTQGDIDLGNPCPAFVFNYFGENSSTDCMKVELYVKRPNSTSNNVLNSKLWIRYSQESNNSEAEITSVDRPLEEWLHERPYSENDLDSRILSSKLYARLGIKLELGCSFKHSRRGVIFVDLGPNVGCLPKGAIGLVMPFYPVTYTEKIKKNEPFTTVNGFVLTHLKKSFQQNNKMLKQISKFYPKFSIKLIESLHITECQHLHAIVQAARNNNILIEPHTEIVAYAGPKALNGSAGLDRPNQWRNVEFSDSKLENIFQQNLNLIETIVSTDLVKGEFVMKELPAIWQLTLVSYTTSLFIGDMPRILQPFYVKEELRFASSPESLVVLARQSSSTAVTFNYITETALSQIGNIRKSFTLVNEQVSLSLYGVENISNAPSFNSKALAVNRDNLNVIVKELATVRSPKGVAFTSAYNLKIVKETALKLGGILDVLFQSLSTQTHIHVVIGTHYHSLAPELQKSYRLETSSAVAYEESLLALIGSSEAKDFYEYDGPTASNSNQETPWNSFIKQLKYYKTLLKGELDFVQGQLQELSLNLNTYLEYLVSQLPLLKENVSSGSLTDKDYQKILADTRELIDLSFEVAVSKQIVEYFSSTLFNTKNFASLSNQFGFSFLNFCLIDLERPSVNGAPTETQNFLEKFSSAFTNYQTSFDLKDYGPLLEVAFQQSPNMGPQLCWGTFPLLLASTVLRNRYDTSSIGSNIQLQLNSLIQTYGNTVKVAFFFGKIVLKYEALETNLKYEFLTNRDTNYYKIYCQLCHPTLTTNQIVEKLNLKFDRGAFNLLNSRLESKSNTNPLSLMVVFRRGMVNVSRNTTTKKPLTPRDQSLADRLREKAKKLRSEKPEDL